jgi:hypothetical protein
MKLYFNGCSHTYGDDLDCPATQAWPAVLAQQLNYQFTNDSVPGGTNDRTIYRTIKNINKFDKFYIAWTYTHRFTKYRNDNNHEVNFNPELKHQLYSNDPSFVTYGKLHYATWHNELYAFKQWLQDIILLQSLFETHRKSYLMLNTTNNLIDRWTVSWKNFNSSVKSLLCFDSMNDDQLKQEHNEIQELISQINQDRFVGWNSWWLTKMVDHYPCGPTGHLLADGHFATAQYIIDHDTH